MTPDRSVAILARPINQESEMSENNGRKIVRVAEGNSVLHGQIIRFVFEFADGAEQPFHCDHQDMPKIMHYLGQFTKLAERARSSLPGGSAELVTPHHVVDTLTATGTNNEGIAIRFLTDEGFPVDVAMRRPQIEKLISQLNAEIGRDGSSRSHLS